MAADIFFTDNRAWSTSSASFDGLMSRAISNCAKDDRIFVEILAESMTARCLDINLQNDRHVQFGLTARVLEAARQELDELRADPTTHPGSILILEDLVAISRAYLSELTSCG